MGTDTGLQQKIPLRALVLGLGRRTAPFPQGGCCALSDTKKKQLRAMWSRKAKSLTPSTSFAEYAHSAEAVLRRQLLQQRLRFLQIARVEPLSEPFVNRSE
jgi:hypothetical protein